MRRQHVVDQNDDEDERGSSASSRSISPSTATSTTSPSVIRSSSNHRFFHSPYSPENLNRNNWNTEEDDYDDGSKSTVLLAATRQHSTYILEKQRRDEEAKIKRQEEEAERLQKEEDMKRGKQYQKRQKITSGVVIGGNQQQTMLKKKKRNKLLLQQKQQEQETANNNNESNGISPARSPTPSPLTLSAAAEAVSEMSIFRFWAIDRALLKIVVLILPGWCRVAGGLTASAPSGFIDYLLSVIPIAILGMFFVTCAYHIWKAISAVEGTSTASGVEEDQECSATSNRKFKNDKNKYEDPLLHQEKLILSKTRASSLALRKKIIREQREKEQEELMTPLMKRRLEKKKMRQQTKQEKELAEFNHQRQHQQKIRQLIQAELDREDREFAEEQEEETRRNNHNNNKKKSSKGYYSSRAHLYHDDDDDEFAANYHQRYDNDEEQEQNQSINIMRQPTSSSISRSPASSHTSSPSRHHHQHHRPDPLFFVERSELYFPLGASSKLQHFIHRGLQHPISRFLLVGNHTWFNPYFILDPNVAGQSQLVPGPGLHTNFPYVFSTYWGPLKRPPKIDLMKKKNAIMSSRRRTKRRNEYSDEEDDEELQTFTSSTPSSRKYRYSEHQQLLIFETSIKQRVSSIWFFISLLANLFAMSFVGAADIEPQSCYGAFFVTLFSTTLPLFLGSLIQKVKEHILEIMVRIILAV